ncbi:hypothetical protein [Chryseobacterium sp. c4a]|uniref:hypothetical protein n=1 Tax=Chryseobacterium sp. c4a TaxID=1573582 RepID=UPI00135BF966|nr:hypothetical protein [Chryseobacterium sp. c4a]
MSKKIFKSATLNKGLYILGICCSIVCLGQKIPNLEGEYYLKGSQSGLYIFNKNQFLIFGYATAVKGKVEVMDDEVIFKVDHPDNTFLLYGRNSGNDRILFNENILRYGIFFGNSSTKETEPLLKSVQKEESVYCRSHKYFLPYTNDNFFIVRSEDDPNLLTYFNNDKKYTDLLLEYLPADPDVSFLNGIFLIKNGKLHFDNKNIQKRDLHLTTEIKKIITGIDQIDSVFDKNVIYLNEEYEPVVSETIDLKQYSYNKLSNQYTRKKILKSDQESLNILYRYDKISPIIYSNAKFKQNINSFLNMKCLKTPKAFIEENNDKKAKDSTVYIKPMSVNGTILEKPGKSSMEHQ